MSFELKKAVRSELPLFIGLCGPSGGGKTYSALRLATGIQQVSGGAIGYIDTEGGRALHYADSFDFHHMDFAAPYSSERYMQAIDACWKGGCKVVVVDSMSHEHEGPGGHLEQHEAEVQRLLKAWKTNERDKVQFAAWQRPKQERQRLLHRIMASKVHVILCFRAKRKLRLPTQAEKAAGKRQPIDMGWMPIAGQEFAYEMTALGVLPPGANGVPDWQTQDPGTEMIRKRPRQFESILAPGAQLSEEMGHAMAVWAKGEIGQDSFTELQERLQNVENIPDLEIVVGSIKAAKLSTSRSKELGRLYVRKKNELEGK